MNYIVLEMQTNNGTTAVVPPIVYSDRNEAESKFHQILAFAATSAVEEHAASLLTHDGRLIRYECYKHEPQQQSEEPVEE